MNYKTFKEIKTGDYVYIRSIFMYSEDPNVVYLKKKVLNVRFDTNDIIVVEVEGFSFYTNHINESSTISAFGDNEYYIYTTNAEYVKSTVEYLNNVIDLHKEKINNLKKQIDETNRNIES